MQWAVNDNFVLRQRELAGHVSHRTWQSSAEWRRAIELHDEVIAQSKYEKALLSDVANASQQSRDALRGLNELDATVRASLEDQHQVPNSSESLALKTLLVPVMQWIRIQPAYVRTSPRVCNAHRYGTCCARKSSRVSRIRKSVRRLLSLTTPCLIASSVRGINYPFFRYGAQIR